MSGPLKGRELGTSRPKRTRGPDSPLCQQDSHFLDIEEDFHICRAVAISLTIHEIILSRKGPSEHIEVLVPYIITLSLRTY